MFYKYNQIIEKYISKLIDEKCCNVPLIYLKYVITSMCECILINAINIICLH